MQAILCLTDSFSIIDPTSVHTKPQVALHDIVPETGMGVLFQKKEERRHQKLVAGRRSKMNKDFTLKDCGLRVETRGEDEAPETNCKEMSATNDHKLIPSPVSVRETLAIPRQLGSSPVTTKTILQDDRIVTAETESILSDHLHQSSSRKNQRKRKKVHFVESTGIPHSPIAPTASVEKAAIWYSRQELAELKQDAKRLCKRAWKDNKSDFDQIYYPPPPQAVMQGDASGVDTGLSQASQKLAESLHFATCRGLEHLCSQKLCLARSMTVLNASTELMLEQLAQSNLLPDQLAVKQSAASDPANRIADVYATASLPAVRFARLVALADALSAGNGPRNRAVSDHTIHGASGSDS